MTDGIYLNTRGSGHFISHDTPAEPLHTEPQREHASPILDPSTFASWLDLQPVEVSIDLLYRIAHDLATNKGWPGVAFEVRRAAFDLKTLTRHGTL